MADRQTTTVQLDTSHFTHLRRMRSLLVALCITHAAATAASPEFVYDPPLPFANQNPLTSVDGENLIAKARASVGSVEPLRRVLCKAARGDSINVVVAGGSVTAGTGCASGQFASLDCAWPNVLEVFLNSAFPTSDPSKKHRVENLSERASSSIVAVEILAPHRARLGVATDLIIVDYAVNDASNIQIKPAFRRKTEHFERQRHNSSSSCSSLRGDYRDRLMVATERIVRWGISLPSQPALVYLETFNSRVPWAKQAQEVHAVVASYYELPMISYRDAVWHLWQRLRRSSDSSKEECTRLGLAPLCSEAFWTSKGLHPPRHVHQLLAGLIAGTFIEEWKNGCAAAKDEAPGSKPRSSTHHPSSSRAIAPLFGSTTISSSEGSHGRVDGYCGTPITVMSTLSTSASLLKPLRPRAQGSAWQLEEDVPGKKGWITYGHSIEGGASELIFDMQFKAGGLDVGFLKSYEGLGRARLWLEGGTTGPTRSKPMVLDATWDEHKSEVAKVHISGVGSGRRAVHIQAMCARSSDGAAKAAGKLRQEGRVLRRKKDRKHRHDGEEEDRNRWNHHNKGVDEEGKGQEMVQAEVLAEAEEEHEEQDEEQQGGVCKFKLLLLMSC